MNKEKTYFLDMFSGIGGFALAAYNTGLRFNGHYFSEIDKYAVKIYEKRFPNAVSLGDIRSVDYAKLPKGRWLISGGFPCQPHSFSGKRRGGKDKRDLWLECKRVIGDLRPEIALFENVHGLLSSNGGKFFNKVLSDISESGYDAEWQIISANEAGAPHLRERVWIVSYPQSDGSAAQGFADNKKKQEIDESRTGLCLEPSGFCQFVSVAERSRDVRRDGELETVKKISKRHRGSAANGGRQWWAVEPNVGRVAYGIPFRVDRLRCLGNAIVPQCAELIMRLPAFDRWRVL